MAIPAILLAQHGSAVFPIVAAAVAWGRRPPAPLGWVAAWCGFMFVTGFVDLLVARLTGTNRWIAYLAVPVESTIVLWFLSVWQPNELLRLIYRVAIPIAMAATALILLVADRPRAFDLVVAPALALLTLVGLLQTLVHRSLVSTQTLLRQDWFWVCLGTSVFWLGFVSVPPFHRAFIDTHADWVRVAYVSRAWVNIGAFLLISWGILCQRIPARYSGYSLPAR